MCPLPDFPDSQWVIQNPIGKAHILVERPRTLEMSIQSLWKHFSIGCYVLQHKFIRHNHRESKGMQTFLFTKILGLRFNFSNVLEIKDHLVEQSVYIYYIQLLKLKMFDIYRMHYKYRSPMIQLHVSVCVYTSVGGRVFARDEQGPRFDSLALGGGEDEK